MDLNEDVMVFLEGCISEVADAAVIKAYWNTLASGNSVLEDHDGELVEVFPDGKRVVKRTLEPSMTVTIGQRVEL